MTAPIDDLCIVRPPREQAVHCRRCPRPLPGARPQIWSHSGLCPRHDDLETSQAPAGLGDDRLPPAGSSGQHGSAAVLATFAPGSPPAAVAPTHGRPPYAGCSTGTPTGGAGCDPHRTVAP